MRYFELKELFQKSKYDWKWIKKRPMLLYTASFHVPENNQEIVVIIRKLNEGFIWEFIFGNRDPETNTLNLEPTGTNNSLAIFSTLADIFKNFYQQEQPWYLTFGTPDGKQSRKRLYITFAKKIAKEYNAKIKTKIDDEDIDFVLDFGEPSIYENNINEKYADIVEPLSMMAQEIYDELPHSFDEKYEIREPFSQQFIKKIENKHEMFYHVCDYINRFVPIIIVNSYHPSRFKGMYQHDIASSSRVNEAIVIFAREIIEDTPEKLYREEIKNNKKYISTMVHELRHVMQRQHFAKYYEKVAKTSAEVDQDIQKKQKHYRKNPVEIDAAFVHILYDNLETDNIKDFVNQVMDKFSEYKDLTKKQYDHYKRKAAQFYTQKNQQDDKNTTIHDRLKNKKQKIIDTLQDFASTVNKETLDLRDIGSKETKRFFYPFARVNQAFFRALQENLDNLADNPILLIHLGILNRLAKAHDIDLPIGSIIKMNKIVIQEHLQNLKDKPETIKDFDKKFLTTLVKDLQKHVN